MSVAPLFIDGVGIGRPDPRINPLAGAHHLLSQFDDQSGEPLPGGYLWSVDATFGVPGRPQSASNQTALLTGKPAPALIGKNLLGYPNAALRSLLEKYSIVKRMVDSGRSATFANCYPAGYLDALKLFRPSTATLDVAIPTAAARRLRPSATTVAMTAAGVSLRTFDDARAGRGLTNDIDGSIANARGFKLPRRTPREAAEIFWELARPVDFALFEHYLADEAGHARDFERARTVLGTFDRFCRAVVALRPKGTHLLICSDHGNVEDLSSRNHTLNRIPILSFSDSSEPTPPPESLSDLGQFILRELGIGEPSRR